MLELNYKEFGKGEPVVILHGLFGTLDNWQTIARQLSHSHSVYIIDQRNHGRSPHTHVHDYPTMAEDLHHFMESHWMFHANVIGHSMGGKTAMQFALEHPGMVDRLVVVDIAPKAYPERHNHIFDALFSLDLHAIRDRKEAESFLAGRIEDPGERQFLLKNLTRKSGSLANSGGFEWKMNLPVIHKHYGDMLASVGAGQVFEKPTLFIRGSHSEHIAPGDEVLIKKQFPLATIETVEGAGHWVHADKPVELLKLVQDFLIAR